MFQFASYSVAKRLGLLSASAILGLAILLSYFMLTERSMLLQERQASVRQAVEVAHGIVGYYYDLSTKGKMPEADAKQAAMATLRALRYSGTEYFWINDMKPVMLMHPIKPRARGQGPDRKQGPHWQAPVRGIRQGGAGQRRGGRALHVAQAG